MKKKNALKTILKSVFFAGPFVLGTCGFLISGEKVTDSMFLSAVLYALNYTDSPANVLIEIARWWAALATMAAVMLAVSHCLKYVMAWLKKMFSDGIACYGTQTDVETVKNNFDCAVTEMQDRILPAKKYLLCSSEEDNVAFYTAHKEKFGNHEVYIRRPGIRANGIKNGNVKFFDPEETAARCYWAESELYSLAECKDYKLKIAIIGFENLGRRVLLHGLQMNIFSPDQQIEYHVIGNSEGFAQIYHELDSITDRIIYHIDPWYDHLDVISSSDMVIVASQSNQFELLQELLFAVPGRTFDVFASEENNLPDILADIGRCRMFYWKQKILTPESIFRDKDIIMAKRVNLRYAKLYGNVDENAENLESEWKKLDAFTRSSNISAADYQVIRNQMIKQRGYGSAADIPEDEMMLFAELEHERWCRFHYINNWKTQDQSAEKRKDANLKLHKDLVPFSELSDETKRKDVEVLYALADIR